MGKARKKGRRGNRWRLGALVLLLVATGLAALFQIAPRYYSLELCPLLRPGHPLWERHLEAALATPRAMFTRLMGKDPEARREKVIALTFDDGPYGMYTPLLLDVLRRYQVPATFFLVGRHVREFPELSREIMLEGHEVANHTDVHKRGAELGLEGFTQDVLRAEDSLARYTGVRTNLFRPAGGHLDPDYLERVQSLGYTVVDYTVNPGDWWVEDADTLYRGSFRGRSREGVVLLHSGSIHTVKMLPGYISELRDRGFRFVTVSQLARISGLNLPLNPRMRPQERKRTLSNVGLEETAAAR